MSQTIPAAFPPSQVRAAIVAGCIIAFVSFGFSATFGVFLRPMSADLGWPREVFALSMAIQALSWGLIDRIVAPEALMDTVTALAADACGASAAHVAGIKNLI